MAAVLRKDLTHYLDEILELEQWPDDPSNNGLQFEGMREVSCAVFGVDSSEMLFRRAAELHAGFIFVHHGISWGPGIKHIDGILAKRISTLAKHEISLYAAHLPLDANESFGHNARLAAMLGIAETAPFGTYHGTKIGVRGTLSEPKTVSELAKIYQNALPSTGPIRIIGIPERKVRTMGIISGGGAWPGLFDEIAQWHVDCLVTGEATHEVFHCALETDTQILTLGHYRSETPGVFAVMDLVKSQFNIDAQFVDFPTGM